MVGATLRAPSRKEGEKPQKVPPSRPIHAISPNPANPRRSECLEREARRPYHRPVSNLARPSAATSYDRVAYPFRAYPHSHPQHLATLATLFGLEQPPVETCRVLELGCAVGGNIIPLADEMPHAWFLGIDNAASQIEAGRAMAKSLGLRNLELRRASITDIPDASPAADDPNRFDFIIAHGIYSWVPPVVRERMLALCARNLAPRGVAYVSYNTYPGWHFQGVLRDVMRYHVRTTVGLDAAPAEQVRAARALLDFLSESAPAGQSAYGAMLRGVADAARALPDSGVFHDHLADVNDPVYFHQFLERAAHKGLRYLGDAAVETMAAGSLPAAGSTAGVFGPEVGEALRQLTDDAVSAEQYLDVLRNRAFRSTVLCRADAALDGQPDPRRVRGLHVGSPLKPVAPSADPSAVPPLIEVGREELLSASPIRFQDAAHHHGRVLTVADPLTKAALAVLADAWPARLPFDELLRDAWDRLGLSAGFAGAKPSGDAGHASEDAAAVGLCRRLLQGYFGGVVELSARPAPYAAQVSDRPTARRLARVQAERDETVTTLRHASLKLNPTARQLLRLLDGTRDRAALRTTLERAIVEGAAALGGTVVLGEVERQQLTHGLDQDLRRFAAEGLLVK